MQQEDKAILFGFVCAYTVHAMLNCRMVFGFCILIAKVFAAWLPEKQMLYIARRPLNTVISAYKVTATATANNKVQI